MTSQYATSRKRVLHVNESPTRKDHEKFSAGIQGALKHDKIMEPGNQDYVIVEKEAEKVAREASAALKRSRTLCLPATAGVPTWTGQHGTTKK